MISGPGRHLPGLSAAVLAILTLAMLACGGPGGTAPDGGDVDPSSAGRERKPSGSVRQAGPPGGATIGELALAASPLPRHGRVRAAVEFVVDPGLHVNANPPTYDYLIPVSVGIEGTDAVRIVRTWYPDPEHRSFPYADEPYAVYQGSVVVGLELEASGEAPVGATALTVVLDYQACNDEACFAPARARTPLPVEIGPTDARPQPRASPLLARAPFSGDDG